MTRDEALFGEAAELPAEARVAFLDRACAGDTALRDRVDALLRGHDEAANFMREPLVPRVLPPALPEERPSDLIGRYKLLEKIGEGGCGVVWMAEQKEPVRRRVALKVIKLGMDTREVIARFEAERQALALMEHPNIARVFDAGATAAGRPFFVMELIRGVPITTFCDESGLSTAQRLALFIQVCHAIHHAHQKGVIHRDIKPSNILVTHHDEAAVPKVIDFGIAKATQGKLTDATLFTAFHQFIGTPAYMSPEQAEMSSVEIGPRSDVYSLGVLLYELLAGAPPFDARALAQSGVDEIRRHIREVDPPKLSTRWRTLSDAERTATAQRRRTVPTALAAALAGDLDWIAMRCLEKSQRRRYASPHELALDLQRHLAHEPVFARPPSVAYRTRKFLRRHRTGLVVAGTAAALILGGSTSAWHLGRRAPVDVTATAVPDPHSIAVLPFANLNGDTDTRFFADGVHEDVLTSLGLIRQLRVITRTSVTRYRDSPRPLREIARELNVAYLLEGSVRRAGSAVLVTGKLIRARDEVQVAAWKFDREVSDVFAIQTAIATEIAERLAATVSPGERQLLQRLPTRNPDAYDAYLKSRDLQNRRGTGPAVLVEQEQLLEHAVALDPDFGLAWARLAWVRAFLVFSNAGRSEARLAGAEIAIERAGRLIPDSPELPLMRGYVHYFGRRDYARAEQEFQLAAAAAPHGADQRYALALLHRRQGRWSEAWQSLRDVERLDPGNPEYAEELFTLALGGRRYADAEIALRRAEALGRTIPFGQGLLDVHRRGTLDRPASLRDATPAHLRELELMTGETVTGADRGYRLFDACALAARGDWPAARELAQTMADQHRAFIANEPASSGSWARLGLAEALVGRSDEALRCALKAIELRPEASDPWTAPPHRATLALVKSWTGDLDGAVADYARLLGLVYYRGLTPETRAVNTFVMRQHPAFFPLRNHPGFLALLDDPKNNAPLF